MPNYKLVCFDMDGTLITNTNSVAYLCQLSHRARNVQAIEQLENNNELSWIDADYEKAKLFQGLSVDSIGERFDYYIELINNIDKVLKTLDSHGIRYILVTAGPIQVADILGQRFGFHKTYGSHYEVIDGRFTGKIVKHLGDTGKLESLQAYCNQHHLILEQVTSVGDSASDIKVFEKSGKSIAINYSQKLNNADVYLKTNDLYAIIEHIV